MILEDLGNKSLYKVIKKKKNKVSIYLDILKILENLQKIKKKKIKSFRNEIYQIPIYSKRKILEEANLFTEWYIPKFFKDKKKKHLQKKFKKIFSDLYNQLILRKKVFVHKDFHISNMMIKKKRFI